MTVLEVLPAIIHVNAQGNVFRGHVDEFLRIAEPERGIVIPVSRKSIDHVLGSCKKGCIVLLPAFVSFVDAEAIDIVPNRFLRALGVVFLLRSCTKTEVSHEECSTCNHLQKEYACYLGFLAGRIRQSTANHQTGAFPVGYLGFRARISPFWCTFLGGPQCRNDIARKETR